MQWEERAAPIFRQQRGAGLAGQGRARPGETCILRIFDGRVVWVPVFHRLQFAFLLFFTEFVLEGVYIFWGSAALVDWTLLSLAPLSKKIAEKAVCATPKRATLKKKRTPPEKRCYQNKPVLRPKCCFESILIRVGRLIQFLVSFPNSKGNKRRSYWPLICFFVFWSKSSLFW